MKKRPEKWTIETLIDKGVITSKMTVEEAEKQLEYVNDPPTYFAYTLNEIYILKEEAEAFISFVEKNEKPDTMTDETYKAMKRLAAQFRLKCDKLFQSWGPW